MAMSVTLLQLRTRARQRADMERSPLVSDAEANDLINTSYAEWYRHVVEKNLGYFETVQTITSTGVAAYNLPADFLSTIKVEYRVDTTFALPLARIRATETHRYPSTGGTGQSVAYRHVNGTLVLYPTPTSGAVYLHTYVPTPTLLASDSDTIDGICRLDEWIVVDVAIKMASKEESDVTALMAERARLLAWVDEQAAARDQEPGHVQDVEETAVMVDPASIRSYRPFWGGW